VRRLITVLLTFAFPLAGMLAACGGSTAGDPYELLQTATKTTWSPVQVNVGLEAKDAGTTISIDPASIGVVVDKDAGTGALHVSLSAAALGLDATGLAALGISGGSIDVDAVYDGAAIYARSPILGSVLAMLLAQSGELPSGDLSGWLRLATAADLAGLKDTLGSGAEIPTVSMPPIADAKALKDVLEGAGITLKLEGTEQHDGAEAYHLSVAIDNDKLFSSDYLSGVSPTEVTSARAALEALKLDIDVWIDKASNHLVEVVAAGSSTADASQSATLTVKLGDPDGSISTTAPDSFTELPLDAILQNVMQLIGQGLAGA